MKVEVEVQESFLIKISASRVELESLAAMVQNPIRNDENVWEHEIRKEIYLAARKAIDP